MKPGDLKASEKLPRGSYFYIKVGSRFYGGQQIEQVEVLSDPRDERPLTYFEKDGRKTEGYRQYQVRQYWWSSRSRGPRGSRLERDQQKGSLPKYAEPRKRVEKVVKQEFTGRSLPMLVDSADQAKQFRKKEQVESACAMLQSLYGTVGANVSVHYKGDTR